MAAELDHFYVYADVYEALETWDKVEILLNRLHRQQLIPEAEWIRIKYGTAEIRSSLEAISPHR